MTENVHALVRYRMEQAQEAVDAARLLVERGHYRSAINRAYYAMFYAVLALLATLNKETGRHSGAISLFDLHFVKSGSFPREFSRWIHDAFDLRQRSDYMGKSTVSMEDATEAVSNASVFVDRARTILQERGWSAPRDSASSS